jgi:hypothetical protein
VDFNYTSNATPIIDRAIGIASIANPAAFAALTVVQPATAGTAAAQAFSFLPQDFLALGTHPENSGGIPILSRSLPDKAFYGPVILPIEKYRSLAIQNRKAVAQGGLGVATTYCRLPSQYTDPRQGIEGDCNPEEDFDLPVYATDALGQDQNNRNRFIYSIDFETFNPYAYKLDDAVVSLTANQKQQAACRKPEKAPWWPNHCLPPTPYSTLSAWPVSTCEQATITIRQLPYLDSDNSTHPIVAVFVVVVANPMQVELMPIPDSGLILMHPVCGADVTNKGATVTSWAEVQELVKQVQSAQGSAAKSGSKN